MKYLNDAGWNCELFDEQRKDRYQVVVFQKAYDEESFNLARDLKRAGTKTVFDLCDNHFYVHAEDARLTERADRLQRMIDLVDTVTVSTLELKKLIPDRQATVIDDAVEWPRDNLILNSYIRWKRRAAQGVNLLRVVWYGNAGDDNPPFGLIDLPKVLPALEALNKQRPVALTVISNSRDAANRYLQGASFTVQYHDWKAWSFPYIFRWQDVCIIPVSINPFTICKTSNRLTLSLLHGVPVVADLVPSYEEFRPFVLFDDWERNILTYAKDHELRRRHLSEGSQYITGNYGPQRVIRQWSSLLNEVLG